MDYKKEFEDYVSQVNHLWAQVQKVTLAGLSEEQAERVKSFKAENHTYRQTINQNHEEVLRAYDLADSEGKVAMEHQLLDLCKGLSNAEHAFQGSIKRSLVES